MTTPLSLNLREPSLGQKKFWSKLTKEKYRLREGLFLAEGLKVVKELYQSCWTAEAILLHRDKVDSHREFLKRLRPEPQMYILGSGDWRDLTQDKESEGIMAVVATPPPRDLGSLDKANDDVLLVLYQINNPHNLGAVLRSAGWFGVKTILITRGSVDYTHPKVVRTSMGSLFHLEIIAGVDHLELMAMLKGHYHLFVTDPHRGVPPHPCRSGKRAFILGNETHGLPQDILAMAEECWTIPRCGRGESLSLPQAAAIILYEALGRKCEKIA